MFNNIYKNKKVLLTGHTGFKGSWLTLWLKHLGADVLGYSLEPNTNPSMFEELAIYGKCRNVFADILDEKKLEGIDDGFEKIEIESGKCVYIRKIGEKLINGSEEFEYQCLTEEEYKKYQNFSKNISYEKYLEEKL